MLPEFVAIAKCFLRAKYQVRMAFTVQEYTCNRGSVATYKVYSREIRNSIGDKFRTHGQFIEMRTVTTAPEYRLLLTLQSAMRRRKP